MWYEGVVITPLVVCATRGSSRCPHSAVPAVVNSIASCRLSSDSAPAAETRSVALPSQSRFLHRHQHHHHPTVSSSTSVDCSSSADGQLNTRVVIHPAYDNQLPLKRLHSSSEILATSASKVASIDAPLEQLCLPPPLIPVPSQPVAPSTKHPLLSTSGTWSKAQSHTPRRSLPSTPPPVPLRRSVGNIRETMSPPTPATLADSGETTRTGDSVPNECVVCLERPADCVLYTCGHMCMCYLCARDVVQNRGALCPICRQAIRDVIKIFRS